MAWREADGVERDTQTQDGKKTQVDEGLSLIHI